MSTEQTMAGGWARLVGMSVAAGLGASLVLVTITTVAMLAVA